MTARILIAAALLVLLALIAAPFVLVRDCPSVASLREYAPAQATRLFASDGSRLADLSPERRTVVSLDAMPPVLRDGFVAVEDRRFWEHGGVDVRGIGRAIFNNVRGLSFSEGFSTITMQLTRNVFPRELPRADKVRRKICEVRLAGRVERELGKRGILELYLNQVYFGGGIYGVEEAARNYFGKPAARLDAAEAAVLIGLVKNPEGYHPRRHPARTIRRRNVVLDVLAREGVISSDAAGIAQATPLRLAPPPEASGPAPYFVAAVRRELRARYGDDADVQGLRVFTTLEPALQHATQQALVAQIERIEDGDYGRYPHGAPEGELTPATGSGSPYLQGMAIVLDVRTGGVRALAGGRDFTHSSYDRALLAQRQPGSAFKPILFAAALEAGMTPASRIATTPLSVGGGAGGWTPEDLAPDSLNEMSMREALALSSNRAAVRIGELVGHQRVIRTARALGITTDIPAVPSITLGSAEVVPAQFVAAYATLGNGGVRVEPTLIERVEDAHGRVLWRAEPPATQAIDPDVAFITTNMMRDVVDRGTANSVRRNGFYLPAAGKTGTTNDAKDVWFVGMTPDLAAGVWLGFDRPTSIAPFAYGGTLAAPVWTELMRAAYTTRPVPAAWAPPPTIVQAEVDGRTGGLATPDCPLDDIRIEYFRADTEPREACPVHRDEGGVLDSVLRGLRRVF